MAAVLAELWQPLLARPRCSSILSTRGHQSSCLSWPCHITVRAGGTSRAVCPGPVILLSAREAPVELSVLALSYYCPRGRHQSSCLSWPCHITARSGGTSRAVCPGPVILLSARGAPVELSVLALPYYCPRGGHQSSCLSWPCHITVRAGGTSRAVCPGPVILLSARGAPVELSVLVLSYYCPRGSAPVDLAVLALSYYCPRGGHQSRCLSWPCHITARSEGTSRAVCPGAILLSAQGAPVELSVLALSYYCPRGGHQSSCLSWPCHITVRAGCTSRAVCPGPVILLSARGHQSSCLSWPCNITARSGGTSRAVCPGAILLSARGAPVELSVLALSYYCPLGGHQSSCLSWCHITVRAGGTSRAVCPGAILLSARGAPVELSVLALSYYCPRGGHQSSCLSWPCHITVRAGAPVELSVLALSYYCPHGGHQSTWLSWPCHITVRAGGTSRAVCPGPVILLPARGAPVELSVLVPYYCPRGGHQSSCLSWPCHITVRAGGTSRAVCPGPVILLPARGAPVESSWLSWPCHITVRAGCTSRAVCPGAILLSARGAPVELSVLALSYYCPRGGHQSSCLSWPCHITVRAGGTSRAVCPGPVILLSARGAPVDLAVLALSYYCPRGGHQSSWLSWPCHITVRSLYVPALSQLLCSGSVQLSRCPVSQFCTLSSLLAHAFLVCCVVHCPTALLFAMPPYSRPDRELPRCSAGCNIPTSFSRRQNLRCRRGTPQASVVGRESGRRVSSTGAS